jgi:hypothetical protein
MSAKPMNNRRVLEDAREAIIKLEVLTSILAMGKLEILEFLFDRHATSLIAKGRQCNEPDADRHYPLEAPSGLHRYPLICQWKVRQSRTDH